MKAINLKTNYLQNPIGIDVKKPTFTWNCIDGKIQSAYQIVCKDESGAILWDSGKVESQAMRAQYAGNALKSRTSVNWFIQLWDENDTLGEVAEASFEIGLLEEGDWKAKWISGDYKVNKKKRYPVDCFKKLFCVSAGKEVQKARAYMTACGVYEGTLNGSKMGRFFLAPGITDYRKRIQYQVADITELVKSGENELLFMLADGWYRGSVGAWGTKNYYGKETKLLAQIEITYTDGSSDVIVSDESYEWTNEGPIRFADNKDGEVYDARLEGFSGVSWGKAKITNHSIIPAASNNFELVEQEHFSKPKLITTPSGKMVLDFSQNIAGIVSFKLQAKAGQKIFMRFGELIKNGEFTQKNIQCVRKDYVTPRQEVTYICKDGWNEYSTRFAIFGFQYIEIEADFEINPADFTAIAVYSDFETTFRFDSSNPLLNKFVENTLWSLKNNSADLPTDCPTRERHGWSGDAQIFVNTASYMVNYAPFAIKYQNDLCDWQDKSGAFPQIAPEGGTDFYMRTMNGSTGWADAGVLIPYRLWKKYNDVSIIERFYDNMKKYAEYMMARTGKTQPIISEKTGLSKRDRKYLYNKGQHYGEWAEPADIHETSFRDFMTSRPEEATAYLAYVMDVMVEIAEVLGRTSDIPKYIEYRDGAKKTYQKLRQTEKYSLDTNRQARLVRPLYFDLLDKDDTAYAKERLVKALDNYGWRVGTGFLSTAMILYVLQDIDIELAYKLLENEAPPGWLSMPKTGATTIWEDWAGPNSDNGKGGGIASLNHYSKGAVCEWIFDEMCGVKIAGENQFMIAPNPGGHFTHAKFEYDSIYGTVISSWNKEANGSIKYSFSIPSNTSAIVRLPGNEDRIVISGKYEYEL